MKTVRYIQRLKKPVGGAGNPYCFGCDSRTDGIRKRRKRLMALFSFDYMGSAEFEYGRVNDSIQAIKEYCRKGKQTVNEITIYGRPVYYIGLKEHKDDIEQFLYRLASDEQEMNLKETTHFKDSLEDAHDYVGWLELDNHFMFFTDQKTYQSTLQYMTEKRGFLKRIFKG